MFALLSLVSLTITNTKSFVAESTTTPEPADPTTTTAEEVRFVNPIIGTDAISGGVEVLYDTVWGTICDDFFTTTNAHLLCTQLGYPSAIYPFFVGGDFGSTNPILLDDVSCTGAESSIGECAHLPWGSNNCAHSEDISIYCALTTEPTPEPTWVPETPTWTPESTWVPETPTWTPEPTWIVEPTWMPEPTPVMICSNRDEMIGCAAIVELGKCDSLYPGSEDMYMHHVCPVSCSGCCSISDSCVCNNNDAVHRIANKYGAGWIRSCRQALKYVSCDSPSNTIRSLLALHCPCECPPPPTPVPVPTSEPTFEPTPVPLPLPLP